jgi:hypothetical protein
MKQSNKFAIVIDNREKVPDIINTINELNLIERHYQQKINLKDLLQGQEEILFFDKESTYDYEFTKVNSFIKKWLNEILGKKYYRVSKNFDDIIEELYLFAGKEKTKNKKDMTIDITISLPKASAPKPKRKVRVFTNFVKVGFDQYSIKIDPFTGYEYVKINGKRYEIVRNIFNRGVLVEI